MPRNRELRQGPATAQTKLRVLQRLYKPRQRLNRSINCSKAMSALGLGRAKTKRHCDRVERAFHQIYFLAVETSWTWTIAIDFGKLFSRALPNQTRRNMAVLIRLQSLMYGRVEPFGGGRENSPCRYICIVDGDGRIRTSDNRSGHGAGRFGIRP